MKLFSFSYSIFFFKCVRLLVVSPLALSTIATGFSESVYVCARVRGATRNTKNNGTQHESQSAEREKKRKADTFCVSCARSRSSSYERASERPIQVHCAIETKSSGGGGVHEFRTSPVVVGRVRALASWSKSRDFISHDQLQVAAAANPKENESNILALALFCFVHVCSFELFYEMEIIIPYKQRTNEWIKWTQHKAPTTQHTAKQSALRARALTQAHSFILSLSLTPNLYSTELTTTTTTTWPCANMYLIS